MFRNSKHKLKTSTAHGTNLQGEKMLDQKYDETYIFIFSSFILLGLIDSITTYIGVASGLAEANLFMHHIIQSGWIVFFVFKLAFYGLIAKLCMDLKSRLLPIGLTFLGVVVVMWNVSLLI